jgi:type IV pilus assembly protein PilW
MHGSSLPRWQRLGPEPTRPLAWLVHRPADHGQPRGAAPAQGLTLIELLVALALSLLVLAGVLAAVQDAAGNFAAARELAALQENASTALRLLTADLRLAGHTGCGVRPPRLANAISSTAQHWYLQPPGLQGFDSAQGRGALPAEFRAAARAATDALIVRRGESSHLHLQAAFAHDTASARLFLDGNHDWRAGQPLLLAATDCSQIALFQQASTDGAINTLSHEVDPTVQPGNCSPRLGGNFDCASLAGAETLAFPAGSRLLALQSAAYYIGHSPSEPTLPSLFRERLLLNATQRRPYTAAEELVQGVDNLQLLYGLDLQGQDGSVDRYLRAGDPALDWRRVLSVRVTLRVRSIRPVLPTAAAFGRIEDVPGTDGSDRYLRYTLGTTVRVRNAGLP